MQRGYLPPIKPQAATNMAALLGTTLTDHHSDNLRRRRKWGRRDFALRAPDPNLMFRPCRQGFLKSRHQAARHRFYIEGWQVMTSRRGYETPSCSGGRTGCNTPEIRFHEIARGLAHIR